LVADKHYVPSKFFITLDSSTNKSSTTQYTNIGDRIDKVDGMGSYIGHYNKTPSQDINNRLIPKHLKTKFTKYARIYEFRSKLRKKETLYRTLNTLKRVSTKLELSDSTKKRAAYIYRKSLSQLNKDELPSHFVIMTACLLIAIRERNEPKTLQELIKIVKADGHIILSGKLMKCVEHLKKLKGVKLITRKSKEYIPRLISTVVGHPKVIEKLKKRGWDLEDYRQQLRRTAFQLLDKPTKKQTGKHPYVFAVAVIYASDIKLASDHKKPHILTHKSLANICNVAEYSVRHHYKTAFKSLLKNLS
jgi:transcription initiation factor TFIIIB Brf1 subunit/transcription initiation factor TFIIB